jgi:hypothetical protein
MYIFILNGYLQLATLQTLGVLTPHPTPAPHSLHRPLGLTLKLTKPPFLAHPTQTTWSAPKSQVLNVTPLALLVKGKHPLYLNI